MKASPVFIGIMVIGIVLIVFLLLVFTVTRLTGEGNSLFVVGDRVGIVNIEGMIDESRTIISQISRFKKDKGVKAIVLRIDSPGGAVGPSQEIYEEVEKVRDKKKVVVSMGSIATSGSYYIACAADQIIANPGTITGSIGVVMEYTDVEELMGKIGFKNVIIKSGEYKDVMSSYRRITSRERDMLQGVVDNVHNQFVEAIAKGRKLRKGEVASIADGRLFSGEQAKALGLVDALGNLQDAIATAAEIAGIKGEPKVVHPPKERPSLLDYFFQHIGGNFLGYLKDRTFRLNYLFTPAQ